MFHHFHDNTQLAAQGSLSSSDFTKMIDWLNRDHSILNASEYKEKFQNCTLQKNDICFSFDDALKGQYEIALPIMEKLGIQAFFFVYSSVFESNPDPLEIYRHFRTCCYKNIDDFYENFFDFVERINAEEFSRRHARFLKLNYLDEFPFYTKGDKWFRYLRDQYLTRIQYDEIMNELMIQKKFDPNDVKKYLWMTEQDLVNIDTKGHVIGLHSFSHPTQISKLTKAEQKLEYQKNKDHLTGVIGKPIAVMAHPCGDYNDTTLEILKRMKIDIGFRSSMSIKGIKSSLEIPREDHSNVLRKMCS
jgi:peptidoglycan/xylan/chitin deacetylase (PgdA/CDA1 family)